jgi:hypothetical protein
MRTLFLICCLFVANLNSYALCLRDDAPKQYVIRPGDTLWSIANKYLKHPWEWKTLWQANPQIKNPDRLYVGARLELQRNNNAPYIRVLSNGTVKLSPHTRISDINENAVPAIPLGDIKPFLNESIIMDKEHDRLVQAPYVVAYAGEHLMAGQGDQVYVKNLHPEAMGLDGTTIAYTIYRSEGPALHPKSKRILGYKATLVGTGILSMGGEPATVLLTSINKGILINDRVLPDDYPEFDLYFKPSTPSQNVRGNIIDMPDNSTQEAIGQVITLDLGMNAGLEPGNVVALFSAARVVADPQVKGDTITIPPERIGEAMIFRSFSQTSFALIVRSIRPVYLLYSFGNP